VSQAPALPLFPLGTVLFPGGVLPLQIFEVRYLDMMRRCHREGSPFGVVCLTDGQEVQARDARQGEGFRAESFEPVGTLAHIRQLETVRPGLLMAICEGGERFRVQRSEKLKHGLWVADVERLPPDLTVSVPEELAGMATALRQLRERLPEEQAAWLPALPAWAERNSLWQDAGWLANRWAELLPLAAPTKQRLLTLDSPLLRLELVGDALDQLGIVH
jgi:uncharacterized protein